MRASQFQDLKSFGNTSENILLLSLFLLLGIHRVKYLLIISSLQSRSLYYGPYIKTKRALPTYGMMYSRNPANNISFEIQDVEVIFNKIINLWALQVRSYYNLDSEGMQAIFQILRISLGTAQLPSYWHQLQLRQF